MKNIKLAVAFMAGTSLTGCVEYADPGAVTAAGAAIGYGVGQSLDRSNGGYIGAAIGGIVANSMINQAQRCVVDQSSGRTARYDHLSGRRTYDQTYQMEDTRCRSYGHSPAPRPLF